MAERRMFAKTIVLSDAFLDMPMSARCLYFTLGMIADDDGFINSPKSIMRQCGASNDDMNILISKKFVLVFEDGIVVIKHWRILNYIQKDRYVPTKYEEHRKQLLLDENNSYQKKDECIHSVYKMDTQVSIVKDSIESGKDNIEREASALPLPNRFSKPSIEEVENYCKERNNKVNAQRFYDFYESKGWKVGSQPMKDWKACVRTWEAREETPRKAADSSKYNREDE